MKLDYPLELHAEATWRDVKGAFDKALMGFMVVVLPKTDGEFEVEINNSPWREAGTVTVPCAKCVGGSSEHKVSMQLKSVHVPNGTQTTLEALDTAEEKELYLAMYQQGYLHPLWLRVDEDEDGINDHLARLDFKTHEYVIEEND